MLGRVITNTVKQIKRSGWVAWASIAVMTLAFFVATVFAGLAFLSNQYIKFIETRDNILVFFTVGTDPGLIQELRDDWSKLPEIKNIGFTTEEEAYDLYLKATENTSPIEHRLLSEYEEKKLDSSLDIQLHSLNDLREVTDVLVVDVEAALETINYDPDEDELPIRVRVDDQTLDEYQIVFSYLRAGGAVILGMLFVIIFFFTLTTVEFRIYNRMEEIGVMQLVGGSLWYIRAPYILEGAFHGFAGAFISTAVIGSAIYVIFFTQAAPELKAFIFERIGSLNLPDVTPLGWLGVAGVELLIGALLGGISSYLAIRRYIK